MSAKTVIGVRVASDVLARVDRVAPKLATRSGLTGFTITRSEVLRFAIERGLASIEGDAAAGAPGDVAPGDVAPGDVAPHLPEER